MNICFVTSELTPLAKVGGLADVSAALPRALAERGHDVRVILPRYRDLKLAAPPRTLGEFQPIELQFGPLRLAFRLQQAEFPGCQSDRRPGLYLIDCPQMYDRPGVYGDHDDEFLRYYLLCCAAVEACQRFRWTPDIMHVNDWQGAMTPLLLKTRYAWDRLFETTRTVLTIHNIGYQGVFGSDILRYLDLGAAESLLHQQDLQEGRINYLKTGILYADSLTTVSPTYAREIQTPDYGMGLAPLLRARAESVFGILNGVDTDEWNPESDPLIPGHYNARHLEGKRIDKQTLLSEMGMAGDLDPPLAGVVSRLASQKGFDLMIDALPGVLDASDLRLVVLGSGSQRYADFFEYLVRRHPGRVGFYNGFSNPLAHLIEAGADMFLMPSQYEPCGLNQMYSQIYGTVPIVRKTGGLADTVKLYNPETGEGTGVVFDHYTADGLAWGIRYALSLYRQPDHWLRIVRNGMAQDFSWNRSAREYERVYAHTRQSARVH